MKCPFCSHPDTQVVETREAEDGGFIRRRRQCGGCDKRFTTYERAKLLGSFKIALRKRPVSTEQIDAAIERIEERLRSLGEREVLSSRLGEMVMRELKLLDKVGYIRFASVYRSFEDVDDFKNVMDEVRNPG
jgi:transcriptional repressor NrdR